MSARAMRWTLFAACALLLPLPFFAAVVEVAPLLRLAFLAGVLSAVVATDGVAGTAGILAAALLVQALVYTALLLAATGLVARALAGARPRVRAGVAGVACAALLALACLPVYATPLSSRSATSNLLGLLD